MRKPTPSPLYDSSSNPYFFLDADKDGQADKNDQGAKVNYNGNWTPNLLKAAFNYQYTQKDPGAFVHNPKYVMQFLIDSIERLGWRCEQVHSSGSSGSCSVIEISLKRNKIDGRNSARLSYYIDL